MKYSRLISRCPGVQHEPEGAHYFCPFGTEPNEGEEWDDVCARCRSDYDAACDRAGDGQREEAQL